MKAKRKPNSSMVAKIQALDQQFHPIVIKAEASVDAEEAAERSLNEVLAELYDFGQPLAKSPELARQFIEAHGEKYGVYAKENIYIPLVKLAFAGRKLSKSALSLRASALDIVAHEKPSNLTADTWLDQEGGYKNVYDKFKGPSALDTLRKQQGGQISPSNKPPLFDLHRAITALRDFTLPMPAVLNKDDGPVPTRAFYISNTAEGCRVEMVGRGFAFACGSVLLASPILELEDHAYLMSDSEAERFAVTFPKELGWSVTATDTEATFTSPQGISVKAEEISLVPHRAFLRAAAQMRNHSAPLSLTPAGINSFRVWQKAIDTEYRRRKPDMQRSLSRSDVFKQWKEWEEGSAVFPAYGAKAPLPVPALPAFLDLEANGGMNVGFNKASMPFASPTFFLVSHMFGGNSIIPIKDERQLAIVDVERLCDVLSGLNVQAAAATFADTDMPQAALCVDALLENDALRLVLPLVISAGGDYASACDALDAVALPPMMPSAVPTSRQALPVTPAVPSPAMPSFTHVSEAAISEEHVPMLVRQQFGAYITCYRPKDDLKWAKRFSNFKKQLTWWATKTDVSIYLNLSGWKYKEFEDFINDKTPEMRKALKRVVDYDYNPKEQLLINNRIKCLEKFYNSDHRWGIILDDDAVLSDDAHHNSSWRIFAEMAVNGPDHYKGVDVFFPINPQKSAWQKDVNGIETVKTAVDGVTTKTRAFTKPQNFERHRLNHVFTTNTDLKGSMFVVRNFRKEGRPEVLPDASYTLHGEDTYFAMLAISMGYSVRRCNNMILNEFTLPKDSHFGLPTERTDKMREGNKRLVEIFGDWGLRMKQPGDRYYQSVNKETAEVTENDHLLFKDDFILKCLGEEPQPLDRPKPR